MSVGNAMTNQNTDTRTFGQYYKQTIDKAIERKWSPHLLREIRPHIVVDVEYHQQSFCWYATCEVGAIGEHVYKSRMRIEEGVMQQGGIARHPEWMHYHSDQMVHMAETGIFLKWFERQLDPERRRQFHKLYPNVKTVQLIPVDPSQDMIDDGWLAVVVLVDPFGTYRETIRHIREDPHVFLATLTMLQK